MQPIRPRFRCYWLRHRRITYAISCFRKEDKAEQLSSKRKKKTEIVLFLINDSFYPFEYEIYAEEEKRK